MGNYNVKCLACDEEKEVKVRKFQTDAKYCKYHRCKTVACNLKVEQGSQYCKYHI